MKIIKVSIERRKNTKDKSLTYWLRWYDADGNKRFREYLFRTEPDPAAGRVQRWEEDAAEARRDKQRQLNGSARDFITPLRMQEAVNRYLEHIETCKSRSTIDRLTRGLTYFANYIARIAGPRNVSGLIVTHIARYRDYLAEQGLSASTINCYLADLSGWIGWCIGEGYCYDNPVKKANRADAKTIDKELPLEGAKEFWQLLDQIQIDTQYATVGLLACTGLRLNEAEELRWDDWGRYTDTLIIHTTSRERNKRHNRIIPVCPTLEAFLLILKMNNDLGPYVIGTRRGQTKLTSQPRRWLAPYGVSPHDFRRWFRTALESLKIDKETIDDLMGHRTSKVRKAYTPPVNMALARPAMAAFDKWLRSSKT